MPPLPARHDRITVPVWILLLGLVARLLGRAALTLARHPFAVALAVCLTMVYQRSDPLGLGALISVASLIAVAWRFLHRDSFDRAARWTWGRTRLVFVYRRRWRATTLHCGLAIQIPTSTGQQVTFTEYFPRIRAFRASAAVESLRVELLPGQTPQAWAEQAEALRHAYRARACRVRAEQVGFVWIDFYRRDPLDRIVTPPLLDGPDGPADLENLPLGRREDGGPWLLPLRGSHVLIAGATGSGKGSVLWSLIRSLGPAVSAGVAELWVCDPKGGMEMAAGAPLFARFGYDLPSIADLLDDAVARMQCRADALRGVARLHVPTVDEPLIVVVVDEIAALTAYATDRDLKRRLSASLPLLLSQGRAPGVVVVAAVQDPRKETLPFRDLFPVRVALRLVEAEQVDLVLGDGAHDRGARCEDIPPGLQGTGYVAEDGGGEPVRVRASYPDDAEIRRIVERFGPRLAELLPDARELPTAPTRPGLPALAVAPDLAEILRSRGFGDLDAPARSRPWFAWLWRRTRGRWPSMDRPADGWVPDLSEHPVGSAVTAMDQGGVDDGAGEQPRSGSRLARMRQPLARHVVEAVAVEEGVCVRPVALRRVDLDTGETTIVPAPCGATLASKCPPCAERARRMRMAQCKSGWHLDDEPMPPPDPPGDEAKDLGRFRADLEALRAEAEQAGDAAGVADVDSVIGHVDEALAELGVRGKAAPDNRERPRRTRSTRRRQDVVDLPRLPVDRRTLGRTYTAPDGTAWRPSMFLTLTCDTYGRVLTDGSPVDPDTYDYQRAARDAIHFPKLIDRFWQNLRRAVGWDVQYFAALEPQRRLAPHLHAAFRGTVPRVVLRQVAAATYHQVWWPPTDQPVYMPDGPTLPAWDEQAGGYVDPTTGAELLSWEEALDAIGPDDEPAHVVRFGPQIRADGVTANSATAGRLIGYLTKYLTKSLDGCHSV